MKGRLLLDVIVKEGSAVFKLFACKDEVLLVMRDPAPCYSQRAVFFKLFACKDEALLVGQAGFCSMLVLDLGLYIINSVRRLHFKNDCLAGEGLNKDYTTWE